jgi:hypothetical protein
MLARLFGRIANSGMNAAWNLIHLAVNPGWKAKVIEELTKAAAKYSLEEKNYLGEQLSLIPLEAWETEFPSIDIVLTETIRLHLQSIQFRLNIGGNIVKVGDEIIPPGTSVVSNLNRKFD